jgi:small subunit ribosomal protein S20
MANTKSAEKRIRQTTRRTARNKALQSRVKTYRKQTLAAAAEGKSEAAQELFKKFTSAVDICAKKNIFHRNKAANLKSKTSKIVKAA